MDNHMEIAILKKDNRRLLEENKALERVGNSLLSIMRTINQRAKNNAPMEDFIHLSERGLEGK